MASIVVVLVNGLLSKRSVNWPHVDRRNYPLKLVMVSFLYAMFCSIDHDMEKILEDHGYFT